MAKPLSTQDHCVLDYLTIGALATASRVLPWEGRGRAILVAAAGTLLGYSLITRYEYSLVKILPMKTHLALDVASGALLGLSSALLRRRTPGVVATLIGLGAYEITAALLTKTRPPLMLQLEPAISLPRTVPQPINDAIQQRLAALQSR